MRKIVLVALAAAATIPLSASAPALASTTIIRTQSVSAKCNTAPVVFGLHGMAEGPSSTIKNKPLKKESPELWSFEQDLGHYAKVRFSFNPVSYPTTADSAWGKGNFETSILPGVIRGEANLQAAISKYTSETCSAARDQINLIGYSEGAWVVNAWLMSHESEWKQIESVMLYGDPCFTNDGFLNEGLVRLFGLGVGCMPELSYPYPLLDGQPATILARSYSLDLDPVAGEDYLGAVSTANKLAQLAAALTCSKTTHCTHLDYPGSNLLSEGAELMANWGLLG
jgi:PE-PPE domain